MRPTTIVWFEGLFLGSIAAGLMRAVLTWEESVAISSPGFVLWIYGFVMGLLFLLYFLITRRRSKVAKWVLTIFYVVGSLMALPGQIAGLRGGLDFDLLFGLGMALVQGAATGLLFTPSARAWFAAKPELDADPLRRTFE